MGEKGVEIVLAALYLRGASRPAEPPRRGWAEVAAALRRTGGDLGQAGETLRRVGAVLPASILETKGLLDWAERQVEEGRVLSALSPVYPRRWLEVFGDAAPPVFWRCSPALPEEGPAWVGSVGSREISPDIAQFMAGVGEQAGRLGRGIVSGGAAGCDSAAEEAALRFGAPVLRILPHGMRFRPEEDGAIQLSLAAPSEPFSRPLAMERNALIYAAAQVTVVGQVRLRSGGTWHGATEALRRRLGRIVVRPDDSAAVKALRALGAGQLTDPADLPYALAAAPAQSALFAYDSARQTRERPANHYDSPAFAF